MLEKGKLFLKIKLKSPSFPVLREDGLFFAKK